MKKGILIILLLTGVGAGCVNQIEYSSLGKARDTAVPESNQSGTTSNENVTISFSIADKSLVLNQPVVLDFEALNSSVTDLVLDLGYRRKENFVFRLVLPNGKEISIPRLEFERSGYGGSGIMAVRPKQNYSQRLVLDEWTNFSSTGKYILKAGLVGQANYAGNKSEPGIEYQEIRFTIGPANKEVLRNVCANLLNEIRDSKSFDKKNEAANALLYVADPIAIEFLRHALVAEPMVEASVINALRKRGGKESVDVLIGAIEEKPHSEMSDVARSALSWIERKSEDVPLKKRIRLILRDYQL